MNSRVLIIERKKIEASRLKKMLESAGFQTDTVVDVKEFKSTTLFGDYDAVFIELELCVLGGPGHINKLKSENQGLRIILTRTESSNKYILKKAMERGAYGCARKPFVRSEVMAMLQGIRRDTGRKVLHAVKTLLVVFFLLAGSMFQPVCPAEGLTGVPSEVRTPQALAEWLSSEFKYHFEMVDEFQSPQETVDLRRGDCEDFAALTLEILEGMGYSSDILVIKFKDLKVAHAVCAWKDKDGFYNFMSNRKLFKTGKSDIKEALSKYYPDWESVIYADKEINYTGTVARRN